MKKTLRIYILAISALAISNAYAIKFTSPEKLEVQYATLKKEAAKNPNLNKKLGRLNKWIDEKTAKLKKSTSGKTIYTDWVEKHQQKWQKKQKEVRENLAKLTPAQKIARDIQIKHLTNTLKDFKNALNKLTADEAGKEYIKDSINKVKRELEDQKMGRLWFISESSSSDDFDDPTEISDEVVAMSSDVGETGEDLSK